MSVFSDDLTIQEEDRVFIDIAYSGCGSGCKYCYVKSASLEQQLISRSDLEGLCEFVQKMQLDKSRIISFCPNTEPFKSSESSERVLYLIRHLSRPGRSFQISTKEEVPDDILKRLSESTESPLFLNISIPTLQSKIFEPNAASVEARLGNMKRARQFSNIRCGLYIKPLLNTLPNEIEEYLDLIQEYKPDYVCIGVRFNKDGEKPCKSLYQDELAKDILQHQEKTLKEFAARIEAETQSVTLYSSVCAIYRFSEYPCNLRLWRYDGNLCRQCSLGREHSNDE